MVKVNMSMDARHAAIKAAAATKVIDDAEDAADKKRMTPKQYAADERAEKKAGET